MPCLLSGVKIKNNDMAFKNFNLKTSDGTVLVCYKWENKSPNFVVQIAHGMLDHSGRYDKFAQFLNKNGAVIYSEDHRGHGKTAGNLENIGHLADKDGMNKVADDILLLNDHIKSEYPDLPIVVVGQSLGSILLRLALIKDKDFADICIFTGAGADPGIKGRIGLFIISFLKLFGGKKRNKSLNNLLFNDFNKPFKPVKTPFDSLSRDEEVVKAYMNDPYCVHVPSVQFFYDMVKASIFVNKKSNILKTDLSKPILFVSGSMCAVGEFGKGITKLFENYKSYGVKDVELKLYKDGRHDILNEINREEIYNDILKWISNRI